MSNRALVKISAMLVLATSLAVVPASADRGAQGSTPIHFSSGRWVDLQRLGAEPELRIDSAGNEYLTAPIGVQYATSFLWKSEDGGRSFDLLRAFPPLQRPNPSYASGDATMTITPPIAGSKDDAVVWSDLANLVGLQNAATFDGGNSFPADHWNEYAADAGPGADRQWLASMRLPDGTERVYEFYDQVDINGNSIIYSDDYGKSWVVANRSEGLGDPNPGNIVADPVHQKLYTATVSGDQAIVSNCDAQGQHCTAVTAGTGSGDLANLFDIVAVDTAGNVYITYSDAKAVYLSVSTDQGKTWRQTTVSPSDQKATVMPWVVAGDPGRVWIVWYGTATAGDPSGNAGPWFTDAAQSLDALDHSPSFRTVTVSTHANHDNPICEAGIGCTAGVGPVGGVVGGQPQDRNMLDDFSAAIDPRGMLHIAYNDTNNQVTRSTNPEAGGAFIVESAQRTGPSLYRSVGEVRPSPKPPTVTSTTKLGGTLLVDGTESMPPGNWVVDRGGDALVPRHSMSGPGPSDPSEDLRAAWISGDGGDDGLTAHVRLAAAPALAPDDKPVVYLVFLWAPGGKVFYTAAEYAAGSLVQSWAGQPDPSVVNTSGIPKIATYQPVPGLTSATTAGASPSDPAELDLPLPASTTGSLRQGARLDQVEAFSFQVNGPPGAEALMDEIDATSSAHVVVGSSRRPGGRVELSVDDPRFGSPITASLANYPAPAWSASVPTAGLAPGTHTLYVRDVVNGFGSVPVAVSFSV